MSDTAKLLDSIPIMSASMEKAVAVDNLSRLLHRLTGCHRDKCREIAISAVFGALADAKAAAK